MLPSVQTALTAQFQLLLGEREGGKRGYAEHRAKPLLSRLQQTVVLHRLGSVPQYNEDGNGILTEEAATEAYECMDSFHPSFQRRDEDV